MKDKTFVKGEIMGKSISRFGFIAVAGSMITASFLIVGTCLLIISKFKVPLRHIDIQIESPRTYSVAENYGKPRRQDDLNRWVREMRSVSVDEREITPITAGYLRNYWKNRLDNNILSSLTTQEVLFVIQDSIKIYGEYEMISLPGFGGIDEPYEKIMKIPCLESITVYPVPISDKPMQTAEQMDIYRIAVYRIMAVSPPEACVNLDGETFDPGMDETGYYIPDCANISDIKTVSTGIDQRQILQPQDEKIQYLIVFDNVNGVIKLMNRETGVVSVLFPKQ